ncbi:MAG: hypothetical protein HYY02_05060 [Chloroflexi bacterium]|nr:hypothetical protein [Chloroflexota bacterium]
MDKCSVCGHPMQEKGYATQVYRREGVVVTVAGIPAVRVCSCCQNAVLDWEIAQQVEDLVKPFFAKREPRLLPAPVVTIVFPSLEEAGV